MTHGAAFLLPQEFCEDCDTRYRTVRRDPGLSNNRELPGAFQAGAASTAFAVHPAPILHPPLQQSQLECGSIAALQKPCNIMPLCVAQAAAGDRIYAALRSGFPTATGEVSSCTTCPRTLAVARYSCACLA